ncbi:hypothetical protein L1049_009904 [Liquidambar formosana]|uniref:Aminotransferase-like plant mobile domain-containing protein n=1 Tax=Liquidambar formosana TaxID=63359 RepID=A0AAP0R4F0_LIQFO
MKDNNPKQLRSNLNALLRLVSSMHLEERHIKHIKRTPFWDFFNPFINGTVKRKAVRKCDEDVLKIVKTYTADWNAFRISNKLVKLRSNDIALIFGIHGGNKNITLGGVSRPNEEIKKRMCGDANRLTPPIIEKLIFEALKGEMEENNEDVARLLCLYAFVTVFFPTSSTQLSWSYMTYVEDLDNMKDYNWPAAIRSNLEASIEHSHTKPENVTGCVIALLYWLCEHSSILKPTKKNAIPRFLKWNLGKLTKVLSKISLQTLKSDEVYEQEIKFTKAEATKFNVEKLSLDIGRERAYSDSDSDSDEEDDENEYEGSESPTDGEDDDEHARHLVGDVRVDDVEQVEIAHAPNPNNDEADQQQKQQQATTAQVDQLTARIMQLEKEKAENQAHIAELKMQTEKLSTELLKVTHDRNAQKGEYKALKEKYEAVLKDLHGKAEAMDGNIDEESIEFHVHNITQAIVSRPKTNRKKTRKQTVHIEKTKRGKGQNEGGGPKTTREHSKTVGKILRVQDALDLDDFDETIPSIPDGIRLKYPMKSPITKVLEKEEKTLVKKSLKRSYQKHGTNGCSICSATIWRGEEGGNHVQLKDINQLLREGDTRSNVIDAFAEIIIRLERTYAQKRSNTHGIPQNQAFYIPTTSMIYFESGDDGMWKEWFDEKVIQATKEMTRFHIYPLLLLLDLVEESGSITTPCYYKGTSKITTTTTQEECLDYGIIVFYIIMTMAYGQEVPERMDVDEVQGFRRDIVQTIMSDGHRSWNESWVKQNTIPNAGQITNTEADLKVLWQEYILRTFKTSLNRRWSLDR